MIDDYEDPDEPSPEEHAEARSRAASCSTLVDGYHDAMNRLRRAENRGTGCHLTADMVAGLGMKYSEVWQEDDPRNESNSNNEPPQVGSVESS
jgi:hypothetical protein